MDEQTVAREKTLGILIRNARHDAGRSVADCAQVLGISEGKFAAAESGEHAVSLPELEVLAIYLKAPMDHFLGGQALDPGKATDYDELLALRQRMLGAQLQQNRQDSGLSIEEVAAESGIPVELARQYESGQEAIPLLALENLAQALGLAVTDFVYDQGGPLARHEGEQAVRRRLEGMPPEIRAFVSQPANLPYLEAALRLSRIDSGELRRIVDGLGALLADISSGA